MAKLLSASQGETALLEQWERPTLAPLLRLGRRPVFKKRWKKAPVRAGSRSTLLLLAALLTDFLKEEAPAARSQEGPAADHWSPEQLKTIAAALKRLTLGRQAIAFIAFLLQESASPWAIAPRPHANSSTAWITARHYFERFGERGIDLAAFCLARQMAATQGNAPAAPWHAQAHILFSLLETYYDERHALIPPALIDGQALITRFGFTKGAVIGSMLSKVRSAQLDGIIRTRADALHFIAEQMATLSKDNGSLSQLTINQQARSPQKAPGE